MIVRDGTRPGDADFRSAWSQRLAGWLRRYAVRNERIRLCETLQLGGRRSIALIECDGQRYLAGLSATGVQTLVPVVPGTAIEDRP